MAWHRDNYHLSRYYYIAVQRTRQYYFDDRDTGAARRPSTCGAPVLFLNASVLLISVAGFYFFIEREIRQRTWGHDILFYSFFFHAFRCRIIRVLQSYHGRYRLFLSLLYYNNTAVTVK